MLLALLIKHLQKILYLFKPKFIFKVLYFYKIYATRVIRHVCFEFQKTFTCVVCFAFFYV